MKTLIFLFLIIAAPQQVLAALCSKVPNGQPCTPDPGPETDAAKQAILKLVKLAKTADVEVKLLEAEYRAVRGKSENSHEYEMEYLACERYRVKKMAQDQLYKEAMERTARLYHVAPAAKTLTTAKPTDSTIDYAAGLTATWDPQVTDSGDRTYLAIKVDGSDGLSHYGGLVSMDPNKPDGLEGLTLVDGRVLISKGVFDIAFKNGNPGFLARVLYHESRHFNRLSQAATDGTGVLRGWASREEEELAAYKADVAMLSAFGLTEAQENTLKAKRDEFARKIKNNELTTHAVDPQQENLWRTYYNETQLNLEYDYKNLKHIVDQARLEQGERVQRENEERARVAREEQERKSRLIEEARNTRSRIERNMSEDAARCGYRLEYAGPEDRTIIGFRNGEILHSFRDPASPPDWYNFQFMLMISRACDAANMQPPRVGIEACNGGYAAMSAPMSYELHLDLYFANKPDSGNVACVEHILKNKSRISDAKSFAKTIADYQKGLRKKEAEEQKKDEKRREKERAIERSKNYRDPDEGRRPPDDGGRTPTDPDHDEVWKRVNPIIR